jgi:hypothetical protein
VFQVRAPRDSKPSSFQRGYWKISRTWQLKPEMIPLKSRMSVSERSTLT